MEIDVESTDVSPLEYDFTAEDTPRPVEDNYATPTPKETLMSTETPAKKTRKPMSLETALSKTYTIRNNAAGAQAGIPGPIAELVAGRSYRWEFSETGLSLVFVEEVAAEEIQLPSWAS